MLLLELEEVLSAIYMIFRGGRELQPEISITSWDRTQLRQKRTVVHRQL